MYQNKNLKLYKLKALYDLFHISLTLYKLRFKDI